MPNADEVKGKIKEGVGKATDDEALERQGRGDQAKGKVKSAADKIGDAAENVKDAAKDAFDSNKRR